jgi:hypothetical protein
VKVLGQCREGVDEYEGMLEFSKWKFLEEEMLKRAKYTKF